jgi:RNA polymerase sigma factor (sigma-70 family)
MASSVDTLPHGASSLCVHVEAREHDTYGIASFNALRPRLYSIACRLLRSKSEAEDIVQDVWLRWQSTDRSRVENPSAFLATATAHLCINRAQSAHSRRETQFVAGTQEPVDTSGDPTLGHDRGEALKLAVRVLLEKLKGTERAAYILREAFDYSYRRIADTLKIEEANARQLVSRARKHLAERRGIHVSGGRQRCLLEAFLAAANTGNVVGLEDFLAEGAFAPRNGGTMVPCNRTQP